ncbi:MAG: FMN-binding protein [Spirochaetales bacterium]|jgi:uncharacterized protein with FMN-binding domain|nr:FMN-binding protein [Exilispira sp.]NMC67340.1 FMN-binding protein [Spirochaetales bacterium]
MKTKNIVFLIIISIILIFFIFLALKIYFEVKNYNKQINDLQISDIDLSSVKDGIYRGEYITIPVSAKVEVTVKDHKIIDIKLLEHRNGKGQPAEAIVEKVLKDQKLKVDVVSGATASSKVILKAIENALLSN